VLELLAEAMGVRDVTIALFSLILFVLLALALNFSVIISRQAEQITRLAQENALERAREDESLPTPPPDRSAREPALSAPREAVRGERR
jgi:hypothetical protein